MPRVEFSHRFAEDLALVRSEKVESAVYSVLESVRLFGGMGSLNVPRSIREEFEGGVRKVAVNPFDLVYTYYPDEDLVRIEALVHQKAAW